MNDAPDRFAELDAAYRTTDYWVDGPNGRFAIRIGQISEPLEELLAGKEAGTWAYITAYNPESQSLSLEANEKRMRLLEKDVLKYGYPFFKGEGKGQIGNWPPEASLLILGIDESAARMLASKFGQNAFVFGSMWEPAQLIWT